MADSIEDGHSIRQSLSVLNNHEKEKGSNIEYSVSAVYSLVKKLRPLVDTTRPRPTGNTDITSKWCRASLGWATQLLIRFGHLSSERFRDKVTNLIPEWYDSTKMDKLEPSQVGWFDECHKKCKIGNPIDRYMVFPRDKNNKLDLVNGTYNKDPKFLMKVKFSKEARFCFGCAIVEKDGSTEQQGVRCEPFDYSEKTLLSIKEYKTRQKQKLEELKVYQVVVAG